MVYINFRLRERILFMKNKKKTAYSPLVILPGINHSPVALYDSKDNPVYDSKGEKVEGTLIIPNLDAAKSHLPTLAKRLAMTALTQHCNRLEVCVYDTVCDALSYQKCDNDGNFIRNLKVKRWNCPLSGLTPDEVQWVYRMVPMKNLVDVMGEDMVYFFTFNLVGDPMDTADELNDYIQMVKEQTGYDKVTLLPVSLGGTILTAYIDAYGHKDIDRIVNTVACLNGTDITADIFEKKLNYSDDFLHHEYLPAVLGEGSGKGTTGYALNSLLHLLPKEGFDAVINGTLNAALDTILLYAPQVWAMLPSYRYDAIAEKYISAPVYKKLRERTDRFQQARLNLNDNLLAAAKDGVKIDSISGSNLNYGEVEYAFFGIVESTGKFNTDGIINISSTTLGAASAPDGTTLGDDYAPAKEGENGYSYLSPDKKIDVSTALFPDNTWIFLDQHHEVGKNDAVLNLAKAIILGEIENVHSDPEHYPQFNGAANTYHLRRWRLNDGIKALEDIESGKLFCSTATKNELIAAVEEGKAVLASTIGDRERAANVLAKLDELLIRIGRMKEPEERTEFDKTVEKITCELSRILVKYLGGGSVYDKLFRRK